MKKLDGEIQRSLLLYGICYCMQQQTTMAMQFGFCVGKKTEFNCGQFRNTIQWQDYSDMNLTKLPVILHH